MERDILILVAIVNLALLIWFIITLRGIARSTKTTAEYTRCLALCHPPNEEQARVINRDLSPEEVLARLAASGTTVRLPQVSALRESTGVPPDPQIDNAGAADPEMLRLVRQADFVEFLLRRQRSDDE